MPCDASLSRLGVFPDMIPWWYAPMLNQPTSSPIMTIMFGFLLSALLTATLHANKAAETAIDPNTLLDMHVPTFILIANPPLALPLRDAHTAGVRTSR